MSDLPFSGIVHLKHHTYNVWSAIFRYRPIRTPYIQCLICHFQVSSNQNTIHTMSDLPFSGIVHLKDHTYNVWSTIFRYRPIRTPYIQCLIYHFQVSSNQNTIHTMSDLPFSGIVQSEHHTYNVWPAIFRYRPIRTPYIQCLICHFQVSSNQNTIHTMLDLPFFGHELLVLCIKHFKSHVSYQLFQVNYLWFWPLVLNIPLIFSVVSEQPDILGKEDWDRRDINELVSETIIFG